MQSLLRLHNRAVTKYAQHWSVTASYLSWIMESKQGFSSILAVEMSIICFSCAKRNPPPGFVKSSRKNYVLVETLEGKQRTDWLL